MKLIKKRREKKVLPFSWYSFCVALLIGAKEEQVEQVFDWRVECCGRGHRLGSRIYALPHRRNSMASTCCLSVNFQKEEEGNKFK